MTDCFVLLQEDFDSDSLLSCSLLSVYHDRSKAVEHAQKLIKLSEYSFESLLPHDEEVCRYRILDNSCLASFLVVKKSVLL